MTDGIKKADLLDKDRVLLAMSGDTAAALHDFEIFPQLDSTNSEAMRRIRAGAAGPLLIVAEQQTAGRGRRGRSWFSPAASNLYFSLVWSFPRTPGALDGLSLVTALSVVHALKGSGLSGLDGLQVKWPNDVWLDRYKLAGILLELQQGTAEMLSVVIGIGVNVNMPQSLTHQIDQPAASLAAATGGPVDRSWLLGQLISQLREHLLIFAQSGFLEFQAAWHHYDALLRCPVEVVQGEQRRQGIHMGVDEGGALRLQLTEGMETIRGGEIAPSLRALAVGA